MPILGPLNPVELLRAARGGALSATRRLRPDHRAIASRAVRFSPQNMVRLYLYVVVAPSRSAPRPFDDGQVARARAFAADALPGVFDPVPRSAEEPMTLFTVDGPDHSRERALYVHRTGLVELLWSLSYEQTGEDLTLDLTEMACVVMRMAGAVARAPYTELSRAARGWRRRARVDWWFHVATGISTGSGPRSWTALRFPGEAPPRARHDWAAAPAEGYGWPRLRNSRRSRPPGEIARAFLTEYLTANGYYEFSDSLERTLAEASRLVRERGAGDSSSPTDDASTEHYRDLADRVEDAVRTYVLRQMPADPSGELAAKPFRELLHRYGNWRGRHPFPRPRKVHRSKEMAASAEAQTFATEIAALVRKMETGVDLKPHLSRAVDTAFLSSQERSTLPQHQREQDLDRMLADWGVHHLHLSGVLEPDGFVERGNHLLFAIFTREDAYLLGIFTHQDWVLEDVPPIVIRNWPGVGPFHKLSYATGAAQQPTEQERRRYRKLGVSSGFIEVDGEWYGVLGQSTGGMPSAVARPVMALGEELRLLREDPAERLSQFAAALDAKAGHPVVGDWTPLVEDDIVGLRRGDDGAVQLGALPGET